VSGIGELVPVAASMRRPRPSLRDPLHETGSPYVDRAARQHGQVLPQDRFGGQTQPYKSIASGSSLSRLDLK